MCERLYDDGRVLQEGSQLGVKLGPKLMATLGWLATPGGCTELGSRTRRACDTLGRARPSAAAKQWQVVSRPPLCCAPS